MTSTWVRPWSTVEVLPPDETTEDDVPFEDEAAEEPEEAAPGEHADAPEYVFDGFTVKFSDKVRLTPVELGPAPQGA